MGGGVHSEARDKKVSETYMFNFILIVRGQSILVGGRVVQYIHKSPVLETMGVWVSDVGTLWRFRGNALWDRGPRQGI